MAKKTTSKKTPDLAKLTYEQAIERLEAIIEGVESGEIGLEKSLEQAEAGMKLIKHCRGILDRAEKKITELTVTDDGELE